MNCKRCGTENPEEAVYCQNCGKRLDGKISCPVCKTINQEEANFCISCGAKFNDKKICTDCGTAFEGNYCPSCGKCYVAPAQSGSAVRSNGDRQGNSATKPFWVKIVDLVGGALAMGALFFALLFTFFIGITASANGVSVDEVPSASLATGIFDYFGSAYTDIADSLELMEFYDGFFEYTAYIGTVFGTIVSVATIVCVLIFSILAIVRYVNAVTGRSEKPYTGFTLAAVFSFLGGCMAFKALHAAEISASSEKILVAFNGATTAGIVLSCVFLGLFLCCKIVCNAKRLFAEKGIVPVCLAGVAAILLGIALYFVGSPIGTCSVKSKWTSGPFAVGYSGILSLVITTSGGGGVIADDYISSVVLSNIVFIAQTVLTVLIAVAIGKSLANVAAKRGKGNLAYAITAEVAAVAHLVLAIITAQVFCETALEDITYTLSYTAPIVLLVFATLGLVATIVHAVFLGGQKKAERLE
ncbi:MAG: zinc ribbon domain-containing protein [Clostridiales bacterium]|nr:zinc ribbon domain-containing protein [Clostridiales bacterium]